MPIYEYKTFIVEEGALQTGLNQYGADGWRLHTCDIITLSNWSSAKLRILVVMDRGYHQEEYVEEDIGPHGIEMKG